MLPPARLPLHAVTLVGVLLGWGMPVQDSSAAAPTAPYTTRYPVAKASIPNSVWDAAAAAGRDGKIYLFGSGSYVYDPVADSWSGITGLPDGRTAGSAATGLDGRIY